RCNREVYTECHHGPHFSALKRSQPSEIEVTTAVIGIDLESIEETLSSFVVVFAVVVSYAEVIVQQVVERKLLDGCLEHLDRFLIVSLVVQGCCQRAENV